jgi:hypothetical protein
MKPALAAGAVAALFVGGVALATSRNSSHQASPGQVPQQVAVQPAPVVPAPVPGTAFDASAGTPAAAVETAAPARERVVYRDRVVYKERPRTVRSARRNRVVTKTRSGRKSALIIGGSAAGGAITGALIGGKKGAVIGGLVGGAGGTVYDRKTRKKRRVVPQ